MAAVWRSSWMLIPTCCNKDIFENSFTCFLHLTGSYFLDMLCTHWLNCKSNFLVSECAAENVSDLFLSSSQFFIFLSLPGSLWSCWWPCSLEHRSLRLLQIMKLVIVLISWAASSCINQAKDIITGTFVRSTSYYHDWHSGMPDIKIKKRHEANFMWH